MAWIKKKNRPPKEEQKDWIRKKKKDNKKFCGYTGPVKPESSWLTKKDEPKSYGYTKVVKQKKELISVYHSDDHSRINIVRELYQELNVKNAALKTIKALYGQVFNLISDLKVTDQKKQNLIEFIEMILNRNS